MPFTNILIHAVWATKDRKPLMSKASKDAICLHITAYCKEKKMYLLNINGWLDHLHCLISLSVDQNVMTAMNLIKGSSSYWANRNLHFTEKFGWQDDYFAVSVSQSHFHKVNNYISNQEEHHKKKTFQQEYDEFMQHYHFEEQSGF